MSTVTISVKPLEQSRREVREIIGSGTPDSVLRFNFVSWDLFHRILAPNRMAIIRTMAGTGPLTIREIARRVDRDFKGVHTDVTTLVKCGLVRRTEDGTFSFPYDRIHFDFEIEAASSAA